MSDLAPNALHDHLIDRAPRILRFDPEAYLPEWQSAARRSFKQLLGLMPGKVDLNIQITKECSPPTQATRTIDFTFTSEPRVEVPCRLILPAGDGPFPAVICPDGSAIGNTVMSHQPVHHGYAVLTFPLRNVGRRRASPEEADPSLVALLLGRTMAGERVWDVLRAVDVLAENFPVIDASRLAVMGGPDDAMTAFFAAAIEPRLTAALAVAIAPFSHFARHPAPPEYYLPNILHYFETADLAGLIAPRPFVIGCEDPAVIAEIREIYATFKTPAAFAELSSNAGPAEAWTAFQRLLTVPP